MWNDSYRPSDEDEVDAEDDDEYGTEEDNYDDMFAKSL